MTFPNWQAGLLSGAALMLSYHTDAAEPPRLPETVVSATRFEIPVDELALNATVITAEEIARSTARTLPELLGTRAGIYTRDLYGNNAQLSTVDIRGFGATGAENTLVLVDGRRLTDVDLSGVQWSSIPLGLIDRVEILRGSGAVQFGDGASAGVINIITRHPAQALPGATGSLRLGSFDTYELNGSLRAADGPTALSAFVQNYQSDGYRVNNQDRQSNLALTGAWSGSGVDATLRLTADRQGIRLPGGRLVQPSAGIDQLASDRRGTSTPLDYAQRDGNQVGLDLHWGEGDADLVVGIGYRDKRQRSYFDFSGFPDYREIELDVLSIQPRYRLRTQALGMKHALVVGADLARWNYELAVSDAANNIAQPHNHIRATQHNDALYALDTAQIGERLTLNAGIRRERLRISATDVFDPTAPGAAFGSGAMPGSNRTDASAAEIGLRLQAARDIAIFTHANRSFRFANVDEIYESSSLGTNEFQFLRAQRSNTYEVGFMVTSGTARIRTGIFRMDVRDEIHLDPFTSGVGNRNMPPIRRQGLEFEGRRTIAQGIIGDIAYTFTQAKFQEGSLPGAAFTQQDVTLAGRTVPLVPRHKLDLGIDWRFGSQTSVRTQWHYVSRQFMENDEGNTFARQIPSFGVTDVRLTRQTGNFKFSALVANLFDRKYYTYAVRSQFVPDRFNAYPLPQRSFWLTLEYGGI